MKLGDIKLHINQDEDKGYFKEVSKKDIAIIGLSVRLPLARDTKEFWNNIRSGRDCIGDISEQRKNDLINYMSFIGKSGKDMEFGKAAYLDDIDKFDCGYFNISPKEASLMDPNHRLFLETAWSAIEDAGYGGDKLKGTKTGVYVSSGSEGKYKKMIIDVEPSLLSIAFAGNIRPIMAGRLAHMLDLKGPNMMIDTTCSSSLVALHVACQSIRNGECDQALVGASQINLIPVRQTFIGVESSDGKTKAFDCSSDGTGTGEGVAVIIIKPLHKAISDRDNIHAVIKGSAINHDGNAIGLTAPNAESQSEVIIQAWKDAAIEPDTIGSIEAHGTGTKLGDPIEIEGLSRAFRKYTNRKSFCAISSVKTNIGHLDSCAGLAGLIKVVLQLKNKELAPNIHFNIPNPKINFEKSPVYINDRLKKWKKRGQIRRSGISSFGLSGTNCHIILEEAPSIEKSSEMHNIIYNILTISAKTESSLKMLIKAFKHYLETAKHVNMHDLCYTSNTGRGHYEYRLALVIKDIDDLALKLEKVSKLKFENGIYFGKSKDIYINIEEKKLGYICGKKNPKWHEEDEKSQDELLCNLAQYYVLGGNCRWEELYKDLSLYKVSIPKYRFEKMRCWLDIPKQISKNELLYMTQWHKQPKDLEARVSGEAIALIIGDQSEESTQMIYSISKYFNKTFVIQFGDEYCIKSDNRYVIRPEKDDFIAVLKATEATGFTHIVYLGAFDEKENVKYHKRLEERLKKGVYGLFYLVKALIETGNNSVNFSLLSKYSFEVTGFEDKIYPENAALLGLGIVATQEYTDIMLKCIDVDCHTSEYEIAREILSNHREAFKVAYRNGIRYIEVLDSVDANNYKENRIDYKKEGVYIITGGSGGIGLEIARHISMKGAKNIALIGRTILDESNYTGLKDKNKVSRIIKNMEDIKKNGSKINYYCADVSDYDQMGEVVDGIRHKNHKINGIIHAAGIAGSGFIVRKEISSFENVIYPKIIGAEVLDYLTTNDDLDFFVVFSSLASVFGGIGQGDYTAANCFLDSFSQYRNKKGKATKSVIWPTWKETGMAFDRGVNVDNLFKAITNYDAVNAFDRIMDLSLQKTIVGSINYDELANVNTSELPVFLSNDIITTLEKSRKYDKESCEIPIRMEENSIKLVGKKDISYTETEEEIALVWKTVLGFDEININESFFDIGGDSILLTTVHSIVNKKYPGKVTISDLFTYQTISTLSEYIDGQSNESHSNTKPAKKEEISKTEDFIAELFKEVENGKISVENALDNFETWRSV